MGTAVIPANHVMLSVNSHRAHAKVELALGYRPAQFHVWAERKTVAHGYVLVPSDVAEQLLDITGVSRPRQDKQWAARLPPQFSRGATQQVG